MTSPTEPPRRVRVTSPRTGAVLQRRVKVTSEIDAQTDLGEVYIASLLRAQGRLAAVTLAAVVVLLGGLPLVFRFAPDLLAGQVLGMPLSWTLLALAVYPLLLGLAWFYVRSAERNERDFTHVVERE